MTRYVPVFQAYAPTPPHIYDLEELCERSGVLQIRLVRQETYRLQVTFSDHLGYRKADESDALVTLNAIRNTSKSGLSFYFVEDSDYARWFVAQSHGMKRAEELVHMVIVTIDDVIEVTSLSAPVVEIPK